MARKRKSTSKKAQCRRAFKTGHKRSKNYFKHMSLCGAPVRGKRR
jgi:hypothetical protein